MMNFLGSPKIILPLPFLLPLLLTLVMIKSKGGEGEVGGEGESEGITERHLRVDAHLTHVFCPSSSHSLATHLGTFVVVGVLVVLVVMD